MSGDTRQRMLLTAIRLFRKQGWERTSMLDVVRESGASRGSLYHYFPGGKSQMGTEAVTLASQAVLAWIRGADERAGSAPDFIARLGRSYCDALEASSYEQGCPLATVALETVAQDDAVSQACRDGFRQWVAATEAALVHHRVPAAQASGLALHAVSAIEGALILSRSERSLQALETVVDQIGALITSLAPASNERPLPEGAPE